MKIFKIIGTLLVLGLSVSVYAQGKVEDSKYNAMLTQFLDHNVPEINVDEVGENVIYLDTRELKEYKVSHIKGAIWVGYIGFKMSRLKELPKDSKIVVYCSVGYRSEKITKKLKSKGYTDVSNLYGGIFEWVNQSRVVVDSEGVLTTKVHAYDKEWGVWLQKGEKVY